MCILLHNSCIKATHILIPCLNQSVRQTQYAVHSFSISGLYQQNEITVCVISHWPAEWRQLLPYFRLIVIHIKCMLPFGVSARDIIQILNMQSLRACRVMIQNSCWAHNDHLCEGKVKIWFTIESLYDIWIWIYLPNYFVNDLNNSFYSEVSFMYMSVD